MFIFTTNPKFYVPQNHKMVTTQPKKKKLSTIISSVHVHTLPVVCLTSCWASQLYSKRQTWIELSCYFLKCVIFHFQENMEWKERKSIVIFFILFAIFVIEARFLERREDKLLWNIYFLVDTATSIVIKFLFPTLQLNCVWSFWLHKK